MIFGRPLSIWMGLYNALAFALVVFGFVSVTDRQWDAAYALVNVVLGFLSYNNSTGTEGFKVAPRSRVDRHRDTVTHVEKTTPAALPPHLRPTSKSRVT